MKQACFMKDLLSRMQAYSKTGTHSNSPQQIQEVEKWKIKEGGFVQNGWVPKQPIEQ
jgi:hypothetical protein